MPVKPQLGALYSLPLTKPESAGMSQNYEDSGNWSSSLEKNIPIIPGQIDYELYIPYSWVLNADQKTEYRQIGISTISDEGEGPVSKAATVMAVYRTAPESPTLEVPIDPNYPDGICLMATPADFFGKSTFYFRFPKVNDSRR